MDTRLTELRSPPGEGQVRGGERVARAALRLVWRDPTVKRLAIFEAAALTGLWAAFFLLERETGSARDADRIFEQWLYWVSGSGIATFCSVAFACAVNARIDGVPSDLRMVLGEVRRRLPTLLCWWLISMGGLIGLGFATAAVMQPLPAFLVIAIAWGLGTLFVVPAIALEDRGPLATLGEALRLLRLRWGRGLVGLFVIGFLFGLAFLACGFLLRATAEGHPRTADEPLWSFGGPLLIFYLAFALMAGTRGSLAVILARDALGDLPGQPPAARPRRRLTTIVRRMALAAISLAVGLMVFGALFVVHRQRRTPTAPPPGPAVRRPEAITFSAASLATPIRDPAAKRLRPGAPVVLAGQLIGRVSMVHVDSPPPINEVFYEVDPRREPTVIHSRMRVATRDGRAFLIVVPRS